MSNAITTKLSVNPASGAQTATGAEDTLASTTAMSSGGTLVLVVDTTNMADGDVLELRAYHGKNGGSDRLAYYASFSNAQTDALKISIPVPVHANGRYKATLKQTAGTNRSYDWWITELGA